jgi:hypothetical protein
MGLGAGMFRPSSARVFSGNGAPSAVRRPSSFSSALRQGRLEAANAEASEDRLHLVHDARPLTDQVRPLAGRPPSVLLLDRRIAAMQQ